jgi:hypothetical protein
VTPANSPFSTSVVNDGQWHHVVALQEVGVSARIYVDGVPAKAAVAAGNLLTTTAPLVIGGFHNGTGPAQTFNGWLDELQIYDRAISDAEIAYLRTKPDAVLGE